jgi:hypothetical protein
VTAGKISLSSKPRPRWPKPARSSSSIKLTAS